MRTLPRRLGLLAVASIAAVAIVLPALAAPPASGPPGQLKERPAKGPEVAVEVRGTVARTTDDKGRPTFTLTAGGVTWELSAGPKWFWGDKSPLAAHVGKTVLVAGTHHEGETELDVDAVDGTALRGAGRPPWAGGPKVVGESHPGWHGASNGNGNGRDAAPGQLKKASPAP